MNISFSPLGVLCQRNAAAPPWNMDSYREERAHRTKGPQDDEHPPRGGYKAKKIPNKHTDSHPQYRINAPNRIKKRKCQTKA